MKKEIEVVEKKVVHYCDECGKPARYQCHLCHKDLCDWNNDHRCAVSDDRCDGDYPDHYCKKCWNIGEPYRKKIQELRLENDKAEEKLEAEWVREAKK